MDLETDDLPEGVSREEADNWIFKHRKVIDEVADSTWDYWESLTPKENEVE